MHIFSSNANRRPNAHAHPRLGEIVRDGDVGFGAKLLPPYLQKLIQIRLQLSSLSPSRYSNDRAVNILFDFQIFISL